MTTGYDDGTFKPQRPLSRRHAVVFMERYYDEILKADQSDDFTRGDMMVMLKAINDGTLRNTDTVGFTTVSVNASFACGLRTDGSVDCWGLRYNEYYTVGRLSQEVGIDTPDGSYRDVSHGRFPCALQALRPDGTIECWSTREDTPWPEATYSLVVSDDHDIPEGVFESVDGGCGVRSDGTVACWYEQLAADVPQGEFKSVAVSDFGYDACAIRTDGTITCWGDPQWGNPQLASDAPDGTFTSVDVGEGGDACAIRTDGTLSCWGGGRYAGWLDAGPPQGAFKSVAVGTGHACAIRTDGTITCWGDNYYGGLDAPQGTFTAVDIAGFAEGSGGHTAAVSSDGAVSFWGVGNYDCCG